MTSVLRRRQFALAACAFQVMFTALFAFYCRYNVNALPFGSGSRIFVNTDYPLFQDIHVMIYVGFGFLMAFLKRYGFAAVSVNLLLSAFVAQWALLLRGLLSAEFSTSGYFTISINELMTADKSCVVVLITMGVLLGKLSPIQFLLLSFIETTIAVSAEHILFNVMHINDGGRALVVHAFGAYFGLAVALAGHTRNVMADSHGDGSIQHSDLFSMIGTMWLWLFFPSWNAAVQEPENARHRAIMNTYIAMSACTVAAFLASSLVDRLGRFNMMHIQSSTLAGGVAMGTVANVVLRPHHAVIVGTTAGIVSVLGHAYLTPRLFERRLGLFDTCGVHNLHGLPGLLSGVFSIYFVLHYEPEEYGKSLHFIYPYWDGSPRGGDRDAISQALAQLAGIGFTLLAACVGGVITGLLLRAPILTRLGGGAPAADLHDLPETEFSYVGRLYSDQLNGIEIHHRRRHDDSDVVTTNSGGGVIERRPLHHHPTPQPPAIY